MPQKQHASRGKVVATAASASRVPAYRWNLDRCGSSRLLPSCERGIATPSPERSIDTHRYAWMGTFSAAGSSANRLLQVGRPKLDARGKLKAGAPARPGRYSRREDFSVAGANSDMSGERGREEAFTCIWTFTTSEGTSQRLPVMSPRTAAAQKVIAGDTSCRENVVFAPTQRKAERPR